MLQTHFNCGKKKDMPSAIICCAHRGHYDEKRYKESETAQIVSFNFKVKHNITKGTLVSSSHCETYSKWVRVDSCLFSTSVFFPSCAFPVESLCAQGEKSRWFCGSVPIPFLLKQVPSVFLSNLQNYNTIDSRNSIDMTASLVAQTVTPAALETWVRSLGWEDPLEEGMAINSSILVWEIPWTEEPGGLQSMGSQRVGHDWATKHTA